VHGITGKFDSFGRVSRRCTNTVASPFGVTGALQRSERSYGMQEVAAAR